MKGETKAKPVSRTRIQSSNTTVPYFGLACDHGNSFLCLEEEKVPDRGQNGF